MSTEETPQPNDEHPPDEAEGFTPLVRRIVAPGRTPEERLERLLSERQRELEEHVARLEETALDLERREDRLRDSRASLERLLRFGASDLEGRELDLTKLVAELEAREERLREEAAELARRRSELGAVELKRASLEQRERALDARERALGGQEPRPRDEIAPAATLAFVPGARYRLVELEEPAPSLGETLTVDAERYVVARIGPSPLPGDSRRCAYLLRVWP